MFIILICEFCIRYAMSVIWRLLVHEIRTLSEVHVYGPERLIMKHVLLNYQMRVSLLSYICLEADEKSLRVH